jgi:acetyl-CoA C-acetyltransferase
MPRPVDIWLAAGVRTPFAKVDGPLANFDAIELSVPVARHMVDQLKGGKPDFAVWGVVVPSLTFSNIAREVLMMRVSTPPSPPSRPSWRARPA